MAYLCRGDRGGDNCGGDHHLAALPEFVKAGDRLRYSAIDGIGVDSGTGTGTSTNSDTRIGHDIGSSTGSGICTGTGTGAGAGSGTGSRSDPHTSND